jgi:hypothetical protein
MLAHDEFFLSAIAATKPVSAIVADDHSKWDKSTKAFTS